MTTNDDIKICFTIYFECIFPRRGEAAQYCRCLFQDVRYSIDYIIQYQSRLSQLDLEALASSLATFIVLVAVA